MRARILGLAIILGSSSLASAANILVTSTADTLAAGDAACTLREAIINANTDSDTTGADCAGGSGADLIQVPAGHYFLSIPGEFEDGGLTGDLDLSDDFTLRGAGNGETIIDATNIGDGIIKILDEVVSARVENLALTGASSGAGIYHQGASLTVSQSEIWGNLVGIYTPGRTAPPDPTTGTTTIVSHSLLAANNGGGIGSGFGSNVVRLTNTTISSHTVDLLCSIGYGCNLGTALLGVGHVELSNTTIVDNGGTVTRGGSSFDNPAISPYLDVTFGGSIFSNAVTCREYHIGGPVDPPPWHSRGHNLLTNFDCDAFLLQTDLLGVDPLLGPLGDNGGPTPTHALLIGSPALDAIPLADCTYDDDGNPATPEVPVTTDQRGAPRPFGPGCDIGAFEGVPEPAQVLLALTGGLVLAVARRKRRA